MNFQKLRYYFYMSSKINIYKVGPKLFNYLKYKFYSKSKYFDINKFTPQIGSLFLTKRCNLACHFCSAENIMMDGRDSWREQEATLSKVKQIMDTPLFKNCLLIDLVGGEPLLVKELDTIVQFLTESGYLTNMPTNGIGLLNRIQSLKKSGISRISISLYEDNKEHIMKDLKDINKIFPVHTSMVLLKSMLNEPDKLFEYIKFIKDSGCLSLRIFIYRPQGKTPMPHEVIFETNKKYINFMNTINSLYPNFAFWPEPVKQKNKVLKLCPQPWQRIETDMNGSVGICCGTDEVLKGDFSNLFAGKNDLLFNNDALIQIRDGLLSNDKPPPEICKGCNLLSEPGW
jgi:organic radical activating enzyme